MARRSVRSPWSCAALATALFGAALASAPLWYPCGPRFTPGLMALTGWILLLGTSTGLLFLRDMARDGASASRLALTLLALLASSAFVIAFLADNMLGAIDRGQQKRTMGDMRNIATAIESYSLATGHYPSADGPAADLASTLQPTWIRQLPSLDGWHHPILVACRGLRPWRGPGPVYPCVRSRHGPLAFSPQSAATTL